MDWGLFFTVTLQVLIWVAVFGLAFTILLMFMAATLLRFVATLLTRVAKAAGAQPTNVTTIRPR